MSEIKDALSTAALMMAFPYTQGWKMLPFGDDHLTFYAPNGLEIDVMLERDGTFSVCCTSKLMSAKRHHLSLADLEPIQALVFVHDCGREEWFETDRP